MSTAAPYRKPTGITQLVLGRKLYQQTDGFWLDDYGRVYDWAPDGKLYEQRRPGVWYYLRPQYETVTHPDAPREDF
jgi:hypothetical protein